MARFVGGRHINWKQTPTPITAKTHLTNGDIRGYMHLIKKKPGASTNEYLRAYKS